MTGPELRQLHRNREIAMAFEANEAHERMLLEPERATQPMLRRREIPLRQLLCARKAAPRSLHSDSDVRRMLNSAQVSLKAGASLRQLQWWDEHGLTNPVHDHHRRLYDPEQVSRVVKLAKLRSAGVSLADCRRLVKLEFAEVRRAKKGIIIGDVLVVG